MIDHCDQHSSTTDGPDRHGGAGGTDFAATVKAVAVTSSATLLADSDTSFYSAESDICRSVCFG